MKLTEGDRGIVLIILLVFLMWKRGPSWSEVKMCYVDPDTGECLPVPGS